MNTAARLPNLGMSFHNVKFASELDFDTQDYNIANCVLNSTEGSDSLNYSIESSSFLQLESRYSLASH